jgi:GWxTD domain-containing protein
MKKHAWIGFVAIALAAVGCGVSLSPTRDSWYAQHYFIMQKFEQDTYKSLTPNGRLEFQKIFWDARSDLVKKQWDERMDYIVKNYKSENSAQPWNTDRARVYLLAGNPASIERKQNDQWGMQVAQGAGQSGGTDARSGEDIQATTLEVWTYPFDRFFVTYSFSFQAPNKWKTASMGSTGGSRVFGQFETQNKVEFWGPSDTTSYPAKLEALKAVK